MGLFDKFKKKEDYSNPPDFSSFDEKSTNDPFADQTGIDSTMNNSSADNLLGNQGAQQQGGPIVRTEPTTMKMPGYSETNPNPEDNSNFNHDMFRQSNNNQNQQSQQSYSGNDNSNSGMVYQEISHRQADLILERLDTIKAELDAIKQRMKHMEMLVDRREGLNTQKRYL